MELVCLDILDCYLTGVLMLIVSHENLHLILRCFSSGIVLISVHMYF